MDKPGAAMTFSGKILTPDQVVDAIFHRVLPCFPLEVWIPWHRGLTAKVADLLGDDSWMISNDYLLKKARRTQENYSIAHS